MQLASKNDAVSADTFDDMVASVIASVFHIYMFIF